MYTNLDALEMSDEATVTTLEVRQLLPDCCINVHHCFSSLLSNFEISKVPALAICVNKLLNHYVTTAMHSSFCCLKTL
jgi:hypothetical protein